MHLKPKRLFGFASNHTPCKLVSINASSKGKIITKILKKKMRKERRKGKESHLKSLM
jgi:hypothetical protein